MVSNASKKGFYRWLKVGLILVILLISFAPAGLAISNINEPIEITSKVLPKVPLLPIVKLNVAITPTPSTIYTRTVKPDAYSEIKVTVTNNSGTLISGATLSLTSTGGDIQSKLGTTYRGGTFTTRFSSSKSGTFFVNVTATHPDYSMGGSGRVQITVLNTNPTATFSVSSRTGRAPLTVLFDASGSIDIDGTITSYSWNFGDGKNGIGNPVSHVYENNGEFTPSLTVTDNLGQPDSFTDKIIVSPMPALSLTINSEPTSIEPGKTTTIEVTVTGENSAPISGANVILAPAAGGTVSPVSGTTDSNGQFASTFTSSSEGTYAIKGIAKKDKFVDGSGETQVTTIITKDLSDPTTSQPTVTIPTPVRTTPPPIINLDLILALIIAIAFLATFFLLKKKSGKPKKDQKQVKQELQKCPKCGAKVLEGASFCDDCGEPF